MRPKIAKLMTISLFAFVMASCGDQKKVSVKILKEGRPLAGVAVSYTETDNKLGNQVYAGVTDETGSVVFRLDREHDPVLYGLSAQGENGSEVIASGGFSSVSRVAKWSEDNYRVIFED